MTLSLQQWSLRRMALLGFLLLAGGCAGNAGRAQPAGIHAPGVKRDSEPPIEATSLGRGCDKAGFAEFFGQKGFAVASKAHKYAVFMPPWEDWVVQCGPADRGNGTTLLLRMTAARGVVDLSVLSYAPGKTISPRTYLEEVARNMEVGLKQQLGAAVRNKRYIGTEDQPVLAYEVVGSSPDGQTGQATELWTVRQRKDLTALDFHLTLMTDDAGLVRKIERLVQLPTTFVLLEN